jgi:hypothetical protein
MQTAAAARSWNRITRRTLAAVLAAAALAACDEGSGEVTAPEAVAAGGASSAITTTGYTAVAGDDWKAYAGKADLRAAGKFWWFRSEDVYNYVDLVQDPVFGQVARITFQQSSDIGWAPSIDEGFAPLDRMWYRYRMKYHPGWTTVGPLPSGHANAYKVAFWLWEGYSGRGQIELSNTDQYILGFGVNNNGSYLQYTERTLPGSTTFGRVTTEWTDNEWWEFVVYYEKTGATSARQHWWKRRLTNGGVIAGNPWTYVGMEFTGAATPRVRGITLGANKNKNNPGTMHISWGPYEVVDGTRYPNPWNMPNVSGGTTPPPATLTRVTVSPDTATLAPSATRQFTATGAYTDGTSKAVAVAWTATGGTVGTSGLYTAPATAGTYRVIGRETASGLADTSTITVASAAAPTLGKLVLTPATASVQTGGTLQFTATGTYSDGTSKAAAATWSATGGTVSTGGLYTAGQTAGTFRVIAVAQGSTKADTSAVTVTAPSTPPPTGSYSKLLGDDWRSYTSKTGLSTYYSPADLANVDLVSDAVFGKVVRIRHAAGSTSSPRLTRSLPAPASRVWYRWRVKFSPGWTAGGSTWTMGQWTWSGYNGAASTGFSGTSHQLGFNVRDASYRYLSYAETQLAGSSTWGSVGTEFSDSQWYEYVMLWEKTGSTTGRQHWWVRRLTTGGAVVNNAWKYYGVSLSGAATPQVSAVSLGASPLGRAPSSTQYAYWGPWEVVDGTRYANPFGMPGF